MYEKEMHSSALKNGSGTLDAKRARFKHKYRQVQRTAIGGAAGSGKFKVRAKHRSLSKHYAIWRSSKNAYGVPPSCLVFGLSGAGFQVF
ncbi:hypothetical protein EVAR_4236_1 [Eumeta japonica]|uniref:Uncharacterized protein n=1 Tax=Eumeta variegata TaxID=151549 RepID=A0A4C1TJL8_EUMVA|nr:hypothetical protein EVAR_4236_1 [Eumeta japonica]